MVYAVDATMNVESVRYSGKVSEITRSMVVTNTFGNVDKPTIWEAGVFSAGINIGGTGTFSNLTNGMLFYGVQLILVAGGVSNTWEIYDFGK